MFNEMISNVVNVALAIVVIYMGYVGMQKASGKMKSVLQYIMLSGVVLGVAEVIDMFQIFPDGTFLADLMYEKEILVLVLLILAIRAARSAKK